MLGIVGEWNKNYFIYDSDDESCKLVSMNEFKQLDMQAQTIKDSMDFYKFRTLYNIKCSSDVAGMELLSYTISHDEQYDYRYKGVWDLGFGMYLFIVSYERIGSTQLINFEDKMHEKYGYMSGYIAVAGFTEEQAYQHGQPKKTPEFGYFGSPDIRHIKFVGSNFELVGLVIPIRMLLYVLNVARKHNHLKLFEAFNGVFDQTLVINGVEPSQKRVVENVQWYGTYNWS